MGNTETTQSDGTPQHHKNTGQRAGHSSSSGLGGEGAACSQKGGSRKTYTSARNLVRRTTRISRHEYPFLPPAPLAQPRPRPTLAPRGAATTNLHGKNHPRTQAHGPRGPANATTPHHPRTQAAWRKRRSLLAVLPPPPPPSTRKKPPKERQGRVHITLGLS